MIGNGFARRKDILQDAVPLRLFAVHRLHLILVGTDFRYSALNVSRLGVPSPYQLGVPHRSGDTGRLLHALTHRMTTRHGRILPNGDDSCTTHVVCCPRPSHNLAVSVCELRSHYCVTVLGGTLSQSGRKSSLYVEPKLVSAFCSSLYLSSLNR